MEFIMDMVHDNPGEERCKTSFRKPEKLLEYGYNTQVFRQNNTTVTFEKLGEDFFCDEGGHEWLKNMQAISENEISPAHKAGLMTMCHIDLFVLPKRLVEKYKDEICDENGNISIFREKTKEIHRIMFDEMFEKYDIDGLIIRVGETYLFDTPYHTGNGAVIYGNTEEEKKAFVELIRFLREEVCVRHNKYLVFRTWDILPDKFHAVKEYYLDVTDKIETHEKLIFSIKHTALDFWRRVRFNPCLTEGKHRQVIEVQCQREYEGKGAYPMYVMDGVINGFSENKVKKGIKDIINHPLICGIYGWSRGGGWRGPYIKNEFWPDLNTYVISRYANDTSLTEAEIFNEYATERMGLDAENAEKFHKLCLRVPDAVLKSRYIEAYDLHLEEKILPCELWMRDDRIGGLRQLNPVFDYLEEHGTVSDALEEKKQAVQIWYEIRDMFADIEMKDAELKEFIGNSIEYAIRLFTIIEISFRIFAKCRRNENVGELLDEYDKAWEFYRELEGRNQASTSYCDKYIFCENEYGLGETIEYCRKNLSGGKN